MKLLKFLEKHASSVIIIAMISGLIFPYLGAILNDYILYALVGIMFSTFLKVEGSEVVKELKKPLFLIYVLVIYIIVIPVALFYIMKFLTPGLCLGFLLFASLPPALASPALTSINKGNSALSLAVVTLTNLIIPFSMIGLFSLLTTTSLELDTVGMFRTLIYVILIPIFVTQILKKSAPQTINKIKPGLGGISVICIMFILYSVVAFQSKQILSDPLKVLTYAAYLYGIFFVTYLIGYFVAPCRDKKDRIALATTKAYPNTGLGIVLAFKFFTPEIALLLVIAQIPWGTTLGMFNWLNAKLK